MVAKDISLTSVAPASGTVVVTVSSAAQTWTAKQFSTECSAAPIAARCVLRKNSAIISKLIPAGDVASGEPFVVIQPGDVMTVTWTGLTIGAVCKVTLIYDNGLKG